MQVCLALSTLVLGSGALFLQRSLSGALRGAAAQPGLLYGGMLLLLLLPLDVFYKVGSCGRGQGVEQEGGGAGGGRALRRSMGSPAAEVSGSRQQRQLWPLSHPLRRPLGSSLLLHCGASPLLCALSHGPISCSRIA
jgi:hypothetical protein